MALNFNNFKLRRLLLGNRSKPLVKEDLAKALLPDLQSIVEEVNNSGGGASYLVYTALLTQSGDENSPTQGIPQATVLENTLGGTVVWTRDGVGQYTGTLVGAFTLNKTFMLIQQDGNSSGLQLIGQNDIDSLYLQTVGGLGGVLGNTPPAFTDGGLINTSIDIRVYP
jgi:hypothetical protein